MPWTVIEFKESNTVEAVPSKWLNGTGQCYYPRLPSEKLSAELKKDDEPNSNWPLYEIREFKNSTYNDYATARHKARKAEETSDLNSEIENCPKRKRKQRQRSSSSSEELSRPTKKGVIGSYQKLKDPPTLPHLNSSPLAVGSVSATPSKNNEESISIPIPTLSVQSTDEQCNCCIKHQLSIDAYFREVLKKIALTRAHISQMGEAIQSLKAGVTTGSAEDEEDFFRIFNFPLKNYEEFTLVEDYLADEKQFKATVHRLTRIGGNSVYEFEKRCLSQLLDNRLAEIFSMYGKKQKKAFYTTNMCKALIAAAETSYTTKEAETAIQKWVKRAKERK